MGVLRGLGRAVGGLLAGVFGLLRGPLLGDLFCALTRASVRLRRLARHAADRPAGYALEPRLVNGWVARPHAPGVLPTRRWALGLD